jgi:hypothetical protein
MALFRDRRVFPRWAFIDSRALPRPRYAKDGTSAESLPTPSEALSEADSPAVEAEREPQPASAPAANTAEVRAPESQPQRAMRHAAPVTWIEERRNWFAEHDWPTQPSDEAVQLASTHPDRPYVAPLYRGLPAVSPAEARARHGRGFSSLTRRRRRRRHHGHEQPRRRTDIDLAALEVALDAATATLGDGMLQVVVWHASTGLALASRGDPSPELAAVWHEATRDIRAALPHADLPAAGSYHLVGLEDRRLAVLLHADPDLGACLTVDLDVVAVDSLLATAVPQLRGALAATSREY